MKRFHRGTSREMPHSWSKGRFLNVDLDLYSKSDLQPLVDAFGKKVDVLFVGRVRRTYEAHLEIATFIPKNPQVAIVQFCKLVHALPPAARRIWDEAKIRSFDIGIDSNDPKPLPTYWFAVSPVTLKAAANVNAQIAVTVYGKLKKARPTRMGRQRQDSK